jgi:hypothetical protein
LWNRKVVCRCLRSFISSSQATSWWRARSNEKRDCSSATEG